MFRFYDWFLVFYCVHDAVLYEIRICGVADWYTVCVYQVVITVYDCDKIKPVPVLVCSVLFVCSFFSVLLFTTISEW